MEGKMLGKIESVEFGLNNDMPFLYGITLTLKCEHCGTIAIKLVNLSEVSESTRFTKEEQKENLYEQAKYIKKLLNDAKVNYISELKNKPIETTFEGNKLKDFRILTEVL